MYSLTLSQVSKQKQIFIRMFIIFIIMVLITTNFIQIFPNENSAVAQESSGNAPSSSGSSRGARSTFGFTLKGYAIPTTGDYNYLATGDINADTNIDIAFGGEDYGGANTRGLYTMFGDGSGNWTWNNITTSNTFAGIAIADCDNDNSMEVYAGYESSWGSGASSGVGAWEWTGSAFSALGITSPLTSGGVADIEIENITGGPGLDIVVGKQSGGLDYYEGSGSSSISWTQRDSGLLSSSESTAVEANDMNNDGRKDILVGTYGAGMYFYTQDSGGTSWTSRTSSLPTNATTNRIVGLITGDVNKDGNEDLIFSRATSPSGLFLLLGNGGDTSGTSFNWTNRNLAWATRPTGDHFQLHLNDVDNDGDLDLLAAKSGSGLHLYLGNGSELPGNNFGWTEVTGRGLPTNMAFYGSAYLDFDKDGDLDVGGATWGSGIKIYENNLSDDFDITPPGKVNDMVATNATSSTITVNWTAPADNGTILSSGPVESYDIRYATVNITLGNWVSATQCTGLPTPATPGTKQNYTITSLSPGTQYYIALRSTDERPNLSPLSNIVINTTLGIFDSTLPGRITDLKAIEVTNNSINLTWTAPADNGTDAGSGAVSEYMIKMHSAEIIDLNWTSATTISQTIIPKSPGLQEKFTVSNLQPETTYFFAVKARDERPNWGLISNSPFNTTLPDPDITAPDQVNDLVAENPTEITINLTWTATGDDGAMGNATVYDIRYSTSTITDITWPSITQCTNEPAPNITTTTEHYTVTGLTEDTTYYFAMKVGDETPLWSVLSNIASNKTLPSTDSILPATITDLTADQPTTTSVQLTWSAPGDDGNTGTVSGYDIRYHTSLITESLWDISTQSVSFPTPVAAGEQQTYTVTGLLSSQKYFFGVKGYDERPNYSPLSNIANETTLSSTDDTLPSDITDLVATPKSENSVVLTWTAPGDDGNTGTVTGYDIRYSTSNIDDITWDSATLSSNVPQPQSAGSVETFTITGLFSGTKYYFAIKSFDERPNYSGLSNIASATTYSSDDSIAPAKIDDLAVPETSETTATLTWTAPGDDGTTGTATVYDIRYGDVTITPSNWAFLTPVPQPPTPKPAGENETLLVSGLEPETTYYFAIKVGDEIPNWSLISNVASGTTKGTALPKLTVTMLPEKTQLNDGETSKLEITVQTLSTSEPVQQANVELTSDLPELTITPKSSLTGPDGILTVIITAPSLTTDTDVTITATITKNGFAKITDNVTIKVLAVVITKPVYNLRITEERIAFSKDPIMDGDVVTIYANITNIGLYEALDFSVRFYVDGMQLGSDKQIEILEVNNYLIVDMQWTATVGNHNVKVEFILPNPDEETDESDNIAEKAFTVTAKDGNGGDGKVEDDKGMSSLVLILMIVVIIIIIVIIIVALILIKRKKQPEGALQEEARITPESEFVPEGSVQPESYEQESQPSTGDEYQTSVEEQVEYPPQQTEEFQEQPPESTESVSIETTEETMEWEAPDENESSQIDDSVITTEPESTESEIAPENEYEQPSTESTEESQNMEEQPQMIPCPTCQNAIPVFSTPCPLCGTELNWG
jgi:hypothetical protein